MYYSFLTSFNLFEDIVSLICTAFLFFTARHIHRIACLVRLHNYGFWNAPTKKWLYQLNSFVRRNDNEATELQPLTSFIEKKGRVTEGASSLVVRVLCFLLIAWDWCAAADGQRTQGLVSLSFFLCLGRQWNVTAGFFCNRLSCFLVLFMNHDWNTFELSVDLFYCYIAHGCACLFVFFIQVVLSTHNCIYECTTSMAVVFDVFFFLT